MDSNHKRLHHSATAYRRSDLIMCHNVQTRQGDAAQCVLLTFCPDSMDSNQFTVDTAQEFHRRMAAIIDAVQAGIWQAGARSLLGYATDYAFGQERGLQTLVLKTRNRSAYVRLQWDTILGDTQADRQRVDDSISTAIRGLI